MMLAGTGPYGEIPLLRLVAQLSEALVMAQRSGDFYRKRCARLEDEIEDMKAEAQEAARNSALYDKADAASAAFVEYMTALDDPDLICPQKALSGLETAMRTLTDTLEKDND